jgi:Domain of unknown function (DUF932)
MNTFFAAFREIRTKIRHTKNMSIKVDEVCKYLMQVKQAESEIFENIKHLSETRISDSNIDSVIRKLFEIDREVDIKNEDALSSRKRNQLSQFYVDLKGEINQKGDNLWGLFSGVTKYTTHSIKNSEQTKMYGAVGKKEQEIFNQLVELV